MYRITGTHRKLYAYRIDDLEDDLENIQEFIDSGEMVILSDDIEEVMERLDQYIELVN